MVCAPAGGDINQKLQRRRSAAAGAIFSLSDACPDGVGIGGEGWGENSPKNSRFEPPNLRSAGVFSLSSSGGEGWGEEAVSSTPRGRVRGEEVVSLRRPRVWGSLLPLRQKRISTVAV